MFLYLTIIFPIGWLTLLLVSPFSRKLRSMVSARMQPIVVPPQFCDGRAIWFHCASGEFEYAKPLIQKLKTENPDQPILVSYLSPSFADAIRMDRNVDCAFPLPWDFYAKQFDLLKRVKPKMVLIARTDFWPQFLACCKRLSIPTVGFSVRVSRAPSWFGRKLLALRMRNIDQLLTVGDADCATLKAAGIESTPLGDSRWDRVFSRLQQPSKVKFVIGTSTRRIVFASTWPEDEAVILKALPLLRPVASENHFSFVIVPHELTSMHLVTLQRKLARIGFESCYYSQIDEWDARKVLIVDQMGILADLYRDAFLAFVGGSFGREVHSVMEPLAAGCPALVGPRHHKSPEALEFKQVSSQIAADLKYVTEIKDHGELFHAVHRWLPIDRLQVHAHLQRLCKANQGSTERIIKAIRSIS